MRSTTTYEVDHFQAAMYTKEANVEYMTQSRERMASKKFDTRVTQTKR